MTQSLMTRYRRTTALCLTGLAFAGAANAQSSDALDLGTLVITAGGFEQHVVDAPASISVITVEELRRANVTNLSDALREAQGVITTGIANEQDIFIRGLPGDYTLILVDGKRQGTRESRTNGSSGYEQSFIPPVAAIERIEVVRGPMSSLYGSDAMGGVVNIITRKVSPVWTGSVTAETTIPEGSDDAASNQLSFYLNGPILADRLGLQIWGRRLDRDESGVLNGPREQEDIDLTARLTWMVNPDHELSFEYGFTRIDQYSNPGRTLALGTDPERVDNDRQHWALGYKGNWGAVTSDFSFQQERGKRTSYDYLAGALVEGSRNPEIVNSVLDGKFTIPAEFRGAHTIVTGFQYRHAELTDQNPGLGNGLYQEYTSSEWAVFAEDEWKLSDSFALTAGLRYTDNENFGGKWTPRLYAVWNVNDAFTLKGGVSTGYRTPSLRQTIDGYYYTTQRGAGVIVANPDLKPETSTSYEVSALWQQGAYELGATLFRTDFRDKIESFNTGGTVVVGGTTYNRWEYRNIQDALLQGVELTGRVELSDSVLLRGSYTFTDSEQQSGAYAGLPLARTPRHAASLRMEWVTPVAGLETWGAANYHGKEVNAGARIGTNGTPYAYDSLGNAIAYEYDAYTTVDIGLSYVLSDHATLNAAIYNLFDATVTEAESNTYQSGRSLWLGVTANF
ncbi:TonB-dependent receptor domain-containing protein [Seohaeicola zhoushanensis]|uniref:Colicin receptor n=1 Tax=Seohaeicola zhoushanensis TaxID=1569283 RepID=A0A8J3M9Q6_9RHOB|nr:TonB-dependent receptor [Seohaeicola zhoushanensis]GHF69654.1 colicin receptor [Seohaeicola zhoushanensis]